MVRSRSASATLCAGGRLTVATGGLAAAIRCELRRTVAAVPAEVQGPSDAELIDAVRKGTLSAYGELYERHVASAYNLARQLSRSQAEADTWSPRRSRRC